MIWQKLKHFYRRMKYLAWIEWVRIVQENDKFSYPGIYLVSQRELTKEEYEFPSTPEFQSRFTDAEWAALNSDSYAEYLLAAESNL